MFLKPLKNKNNDKKAISVLIGYVLLVGLAVSLTTVVYMWLKGMIPQWKVQECPDNVGIIIKNYTCNTTIKALKITLQNKGLFNIDGYSIRVNNITGGLPVHKLIEGNFSMQPANVSTHTLNYSKFGAITEFEILPFRYQKGEKVYCGKSAISQKTESC